LKTIIYDKLKLPENNVVSMEQLFTQLNEAYPQAKLFKSEGASKLVCSNSKDCLTLISKSCTWNGIHSGSIEISAGVSSLSVQEVINYSLKKGKKSTARYCDCCKTKMTIERSVSTFPPLLELQAHYLQDGIAKDTVKKRFTFSSIEETVTYFEAYYELLGVVYGDGVHFVSLYRLSSQQMFEYDGMRYGKEIRRINEVPLKLVGSNGENRLADTVIYRRIPKPVVRRDVITLCDEEDIDIE
jgi:hypothetical protein